MLTECLNDADCNDQEISEILDLLANGDQQYIIGLLRDHRKIILGNLHKSD